MYEAVTRQARGGHTQTEFVSHRLNWIFA
jgi:hypothetical protein